MDTELIGQSWDRLAGKHEELVRAFYDRFLSKFPEYRPLFSESMERQMGKMVESMAFLARVADETEVMHPHMVKIGDKHRLFHLSKEDLEKFKEVFVEIIGEYCGNDWNSHYKKAWDDVFDKRVIPYMMQGLKSDAQPCSQITGTSKTKTSARNQLLGTVIRIQPKTTHQGEVTLRLRGGQEVIAIISLDSINNLDLTETSQVHILIRAPNLILVRTDSKLKFSSVNRLCGKVISINESRLSAEIILGLRGNDTLKALVSARALVDLDIKEGDELCGIFKATNVVLAVEG
jgi:molybdopterin-binding protein